MNGPSLLKPCTLLIAIGWFSLMGQPQATLTENTPTFPHSLSGNFPVGPQAEVLEDPEGKFTLDTVLRSTEFKPVSQEFPNYGFTGITYWFRFKTQLPSSPEMDLTSSESTWVFSLESPTVDHVTLFSQDRAGNWKESRTGDTLPFSQRETKHRYFQFPLPPLTASPALYFVRLQTAGSSEFKMILRDALTQQREDHETQFIQGIFIGLSAIMILYYALLTLGSRSREYFVFTLFLASFLGFKMSLNGLAYEYLWPNSPWLAQKSISFFVPFVFCAATFNAYFFFPLSETPRLKRGFQFLIGIQTLNLLLSFITPYSFVKISTLTGVLSVPLITGASVAFLHRGFKPARLYLLAWSTMLVGAVFMALQKVGVLPVSFFSIYGVELASSLLVVFMSVGLSDKLHQYHLNIRNAQAAKIEAETEARTLTEKMNQTLEQQVRERTRKIQQQSRELETLLKNLKQGICSVDEYGKIHPQYSPYLETLLGNTSLQDKSLVDLLFSQSNLNQDQRELLQSVFDLSVMQDRITFEMNAHLLPKNLTLKSDSGKSRTLELDWASIEDNDERTLRILTAIRDVTEVQEAQKIARQQSEELDAIAKIIDLPPAQFQRFLGTARATLDGLPEFLLTEKSPHDWAACLREIHTLKGNARTYELQDVAELTHRLENHLVQIHANPSAVDLRRSTLTATKDLIGKIQNYDRIHQEKLKGGKIAKFEETLTSISELLEENWQKLNFNTHELEKLRFLLDSKEQWNFNTFQKTLSPLVKSLPNLAKGMGRGTPEIEFLGPDFQLPKNTSQFIETTFLHLFRNSLDHGFSPDSLNNRIRLQLKKKEDTVEIHYSDNGQGLPLEKLRVRGIQRGLATTLSDDAEIAELIFHPGISSAEKLTEYSGRGVGMDAVRDALRSIGGEIQIQIKSLKANTHAEFELIITFPIIAKVEQHSQSEKEERKVA